MSTTQTDSLIGESFSVGVADGSVTYEVVDVVTASLDNGDRTKLALVTKCDGGPDDYTAPFAGDHGYVGYDNVAQMVEMRKRMSDLFKPSRTPKREKIPVSPGGGKTLFPKFSSGDKATISTKVRPTYLQGAEVHIIGFRRGRYDIQLPVDPKLRKYSGQVTRAEEDWLV